jgi:tRNA-specific 2-thiouridylase
MSKEKVLIAMSGGIDSSVAAMLLLEQGYELVGVTYRAWDYISQACLEKQTGCCSIDSIIEAKNIAAKLGFPHYIIDFREEFKNTIIKNFIDEYLGARTPNPCVICNAHIKWGKLLAKADELQCKYIATGHYARIKTNNHRWFLAKGKDEQKDQSYFLWMLNQYQLKRTIFPLGELKKEEVRKYAENKGFVKLSQKRESQEICFIPDDDYRRFLNTEASEKLNNIGQGNFVSVDGKILGKHKGYPYYTVGQRKGLEIAVGHPLYVLEIRKEKNEIVLGTKNELLKSELKVNNIILSKYMQISDPIKVTTKVRYRNQGSLSEIKQKGDIIEVKFDSPVSAITPGQSAVFYEGEDLVGGGVIM